jgi:hypothetical protein
MNIDGAKDAVVATEPDLSPSRFDDVKNKD